MSSLSSRSAEQSPTVAAAGRGTFLSPTQPAQHVEQSAHSPPPSMSHHPFPALPSPPPAETVPPKSHGSGLKSNLIEAQRDQHKYERNELKAVKSQGRGHPYALLHDELYNEEPSKSQMGEVGVIAFLRRHDQMMREQLELQKEIVLRLKQQQHNLGKWQQRLEKWEDDLAARDPKSNNVGEKKPSRVPPSPKKSEKVEDASLMRKRVESIVEMMDENDVGFVTWEQFLAYIGWQERNFGTKFRGDDSNSSATGNLDDRESRERVLERARDTMHRVRARLDLRKVFDSVSQGNTDGCVDCKELMYAIRFSQRASELFMPSLLAKKLPAYGLKTKNTKL